MFEQFTSFDWIIIVIVLLSGVTGFMRGFCSEATSMFGWVLAFWVMLKHSDKIDFLLKASIPQSNVRMVITSFLVFLGILIIAKITGLILKTFVSMIGLGPFDRFLGMVIGFVRGCLLAGLLILALEFFDIDKGFTKGSKLVGHFRQVNTIILALSQPILSNKLPNMPEIPDLPNINSVDLAKYIN